MGSKWLFWSVLFLTVMVSSSYARVFDDVGQDVSQDISQAIEQDIAPVSYTHLTLPTSPYG